MGRIDNARRTGIYAHFRDFLHYAYHLARHCLRCIPICDHYSFVYFCDNEMLLALLWYRNAMYLHNTIY